MCDISNIHEVDDTSMYAIRMGKQNTLAAEVPEGTKSVDVYPTAMSSNATVKVNGTSVSGGKVSVDLNNGYKEITIEVTAPDGTTKKTYALTVRTHIDPANPYATLYTGEHTETVTLANGETRTFTSYVPEGARESCAGVFVLPNKGESKFDAKFDAWKALADSTDTQAIDADWTKQQEKFIVIYLDGLTYGTSAAERAADIDYVNKVYAAASGRTMYCIHEAKNYMVGYGEGGTIAQMAAMDQTAVWAGLATVDAGSVDADWIAENGAKMASSLNGYNDMESSTRKSTIPKSTLPLPVWMIGSVDNNANALAYWKAADHITDSDKAADGNITKYTRSADWTADEDAYKINRDTAAYRIWTSEGAPKNTESTIWNDFLFGVRRWMADPGGDLRVTKDPIKDLHMTRHYEEVGGWMREWYVYVPQQRTAEGAGRLCKPRLHAERRRLRRSDRLAQGRGRKGLHRCIPVGNPGQHFRKRQCTVPRMEYCNGPDPHGRNRILQVHAERSGENLFYRHRPSLCNRSFLGLSDDARTGAE